MVAVLQLLNTRENACPGVSVCRVTIMVLLTVLWEVLHLFWAMRHSNQNKDITQLDPDALRPYAQSLRYVHLAHNQFSSLNELAALQNLLYVDASHNQLTALGHWTNPLLREIDLRHNLLTSVSSDLTAMTNLITLHLSDNHLTVLDGLTLPDSVKVELFVRVFIDSDWFCSSGTCVAHIFPSTIVISFIAFGIVRSNCLTVLCVRVCVHVCICVYFWI